MTVRPEDLGDLLGPERFFLERARKQLPPGVATGLAWTESGGEVLYVEASLLPNGRRLRLTGQLGDVMRESAKAAQSYVWSHAETLGIDPEAVARQRRSHPRAGRRGAQGRPLGRRDHGDGPGIALHPHPARSDTAMTGEITLTGLVLPVGGIKEKVLAARRAGIRRVILPRDNEKDLRDLPEHVRKEMKFVFAERIEDVLAAAVPDLAARLTAAPAAAS